ncbi:hypothetical protein GmHk_17G049385 [Glycine max]|nr:hypothetical protein GmHk_17G049385 [Glycine max]
MVETFSGRTVNYRRKLFRKNNCEIPEQLILEVSSGRSCSESITMNFRKNFFWKNNAELPEEVVGTTSSGSSTLFFRKLICELPEEVVPEFSSRTTSSGISALFFQKKFFRNMNEDQWAYDYTMSQEVHMDYDYDNEEECGVNEPHVDYSNAFNTSQVFGTRDDVLQWARTIAHENGFVVVIMRSDIDTGSRGRSSCSFVLIGCERSGMYKCRNKEFVRRDTGSRKCGCPFRLRGKPVHEGEGWMVKLICGIHNHELAKSLVGHPYAGQLTKDEKKIIANMTKSMVKPKNILLTLKEHNANSCTTIKQIYNARSAYRSSIK